jgi:hypothetical protein
MLGPYRLPEVPRILPRDVCADPAEQLQGSQEGRRKGSLDITTAFEIE